MPHTSKNWFVIINPTSGNGACKKKWPKIEKALKLNNFNFHFTFTEYSKHSIYLVQNAIEKGYTHIICVGGDGTLHNIVNGIMSQTTILSSAIHVGMIPVGTGNDWVKTHHIPLDYEKAIEIIVNENITCQDIGKIVFPNQTIPAVYFNNLAGVGFDGFVVSKVHKYKHYGALAYLFGALAGLFSFHPFSSTIRINSKEYSGKTLMVLIGLCKYSGGGMQLTNSANPFDGLFDVSIAGDLSKLEVVKNLKNLFNGKIINHNKVVSINSDLICIDINQKELPYIQADGELIGVGNIQVSLLPKAFSFYR